MTPLCASRFARPAGALVAVLAVSVALVSCAEAEDDGGDADRAERDRKKKGKKKKGKKGKDEKSGRDAKDRDERAEADGSGDDRRGSPGGADGTGSDAAGGSEPPAPPPDVAGVSLVEPPIPRYAPDRYLPLAPKAGDPSVPSHARLLGWSGKGKEFGYCATSSRDGRTECELLSIGGWRTKLNDWNKLARLVDTDKGVAMDERIRKRGGFAVSPVSWPYADLVITWTVPAGTRPPVLQVGVRPSWSTTIGYAVKLKAPARAIEFHPDAIALSKDGKHLGVVSHTFGGDGTDTFTIAIHKTAKLASRAYNRSGFGVHNTGDHRRSADLFRKAAAIDPKFEVAAYNLSCALALLGDPGAEEALARAVALGGERTKAKARRDSDFESVRETAWFRKLVD